MEKSRVERLTPTELAFVGDAAYTLYFRRRVVERGSSTTLHVAATKYVNAKAQSRVFDALCEKNMFTAEEREIARRAKNAHLHSRAKTASPESYHKATALEAIVGWLELNGDTARRDEILAACASVFEL